jgi:hypothetical protein
VQKYGQTDKQQEVQDAKRKEAERKQAALLQDLPEVGLIRQQLEESEE